MDFIQPRTWVRSGVLFLIGLLAACSQGEPVSQPEPDPIPGIQINLCESLPYDCQDTGALPCQQTSDCSCLADYCSGVEGSVVPPDLDLSRVECCGGVCLDFSKSPFENCQDFLDIGISCPLRGAPAPECGQGSNCEAIVGIPGFYHCEIFCCEPRLPAVVGEGEACIDNAFVEPQCDFGMRCVDGACHKVCDDFEGQSLPTCDQMTWFGPEATCESFEYGPCEEPTGCCGLPQVGPCDPFPSCAEVANQCADVGLTGDCAQPDDCCHL